MTRRVETTVRDIISLYRDEGHAAYGGEPVSQLEHALQCADMARSEGHHVDVVCAAFLHDIGHLPSVTRRAGAASAEGHEVVGAKRVRELGFPARVAALVAGHVAAKRYLTFKDPGYDRQLSAASRRSLREQGGSMSAAEAARFETAPLFSLLLELRTWDEAAKRPGAAVDPIAGIEQALTDSLEGAIVAAAGVGQNAPK